MNKHEADYVAIHLKSGVWIQAAIDGTYSKSSNARKLYGVKNAQTWTEYFVSWVEYDDEESEVEELKPVGKSDREQLRGKAHCSQHNMEPSECFALHNPPTAFSGREPDWAHIGKPGLMRAYGLTDGGLEKWIRHEDHIQANNEFVKAIKNEPPLMEEFDLGDLMGGYGNGNSSL